MVSFQLLSLAAPSALAVGTSGVASTATELEQPGARVPQLGNHFKQILDEPTIRQFEDTKEAAREGDRCNIPIAYGGQDGGGEED